MRTRLPSKQTTRARIRDLLCGQVTRTADLAARIAAMVTADALTTIDATTFGLFNDRAGTDVGSITATLKVLTSPDNPWTAADVGKTIDVAGAGAAGGTLRTVIAAYTSAGSITLRDAAVTTVAATVTSAGGLSVWGYPPALSLRPATLMSLAGDAMHSLDPAVPGGAGRQLGTMQGDVANVLDFGEGLGLGDVDKDYAALQAAIDTGRPVYVPSGTYLSYPLTMATDGQAIFGDGPTSVIVKAGSVATNQLDINAHDVEVRGLRFNGNATDGVLVGGIGGFAIEFTANKTGGSVRDCLFSGASALVGWQNAVKFNSGCHDSACRNCRFERLWGVDSGTGYGVLIGAAARLVITGNIFDMVNGSRGRHAIYLSAGCTDSVVSANTITGSSEAAISIYAQGAQPANSGIVVIGNIVTDSGNAANTSGSSIGVYGKFNDITIANNIVIGSLAHGIALDATTYTTSKNGTVKGNRIIDSGYSGIEIIANSEGLCEGNYISNSGQGDVANTYNNIKIGSDGTTSSNNWLFANNKSTFTTKTRSSFNLNGTVPIPTGTKLSGNMFPALNYLDIELAGVAVVDGRIRYASNWNAGLIAAGGFIFTTVTVPGAAVHDTVTASHYGCGAGQQVTAFVSAADTVIVTYANHMAVDVTPGNAQLSIDVWKKYN